MTTPSTEAPPEQTARTARERTSPILERNIRALAELSAEQLRPKSGGDRFAMAISRFAGSMRFVYFHAIVFGLWAAMDLGYIPGVRGVDSQLIGLNTVATVEAIFLATFVLIAQNRMIANAETRNHLNVHVSLLTEQETTHILRLVTAMSEKMGLNDADDPEIMHLLRKVEAQEMIDQIEVHIDAAEGKKPE
ncbi:MAG: DUF1003 domain-containing protein [Gemmatimonadaceae bacterium]